MVDGMMMLAKGIITYEVKEALSIVMIVLMTLAALFVLVVVLFQPGNSDGVGAITGQSETFFGKNKSKTIEYKLKKLTWICLVIVAVLSVLFFVIQQIPVKV